MHTVNRSGFSGERHTATGTRHPAAGPHAAPQAQRGLFALELEVQSGPSTQIGHNRAHGDRTVKMNVPVRFLFINSHISHVTDTLAVRTCLCESLLALLADSVT